MEQHNINYGQKKIKTFCKSIVYVVFLSLFCATFCNSQSHTFDSLILNYQTEKIQEINSLISLHQESNKLKWFSLLPSVSVSQNPFNGDFLLGVSLSLSPYINYVQQRHRNSINLIILESQLIDNLENQLNAFQEDFIELQNDSVILSLKEKNFELQKTLFEIREKQFENLEITMEQWIRFQQDHYAMELQIIADRNRYEIQKQKLYNKMINHEYSFSKTQN